MLKNVSWLALLLGASVAFGSEDRLTFTDQPMPPKKDEEPLPPPRLDLRPQPIRPRVGPADGGGARPGLGVENLRRDVEKLRIAREGLEAERRKALPEITGPAAGDEEAARLRLQIGELLTRLGQKRKPPEPVKQPGPEKPPEPKNETPKPPEPTVKQPADVTGKPVDPLGLGHALFRTGQYEEALRAYKQVDSESLSIEEKLLLQYLTASCLRKLGRVEEAMVLYREVANSGGDQLLVENAQWHLNAIKWRREMETQIDQVRQRRQALEGKR